MKRRQQSKCRLTDPQAALGDKARDSHCVFSLQPLEWVLCYGNCILWWFYGILEDVYSFFFRILIRYITRGFSRDFILIFMGGFEYLEWELPSGNQTQRWFIVLIMAIFYSYVEQPECRSRIQQMMFCCSFRYPFQLGFSWFLSTFRILITSWPMSIVATQSFKFSKHDLSWFFPSGLRLDCSSFRPVIVLPTK